MVVLVKVTPKNILWLHYQFNRYFSYLFFEEILRLLKLNLLNRNKEAFAPTKVTNSSDNQYYTF